MEQEQILENNRTIILKKTNFKEEVLKVSIDIAKEEHEMVLALFGPLLSYKLEQKLFDSDLEEIKILEDDLLNKCTDIIVEIAEEKNNPMILLVGGVTAIKIVEKLATKFQEIPKEEIN